LRYRQSQYPSGPATGWSDRVAATSRELLLATGIFEPLPQHSARRISGCSEALAACYGRRFAKKKTKKKKQPALCNICPVQPFEVAEAAPVVCVADRREAEAWCLPLSYSSSCHCLHSQLSSAVYQRMIDSWTSLHQLLRIGCIQSGFKAFGWTRIGSQSTRR
jgi:hypothetical protein